MGPVYFLGDELDLPNFLAFPLSSSELETIWLTFIDRVSYEQEYELENEMKNGVTYFKVYFPNKERENSFSK